MQVKHVEVQAYSGQCLLLLKSNLITQEAILSDFKGWKTIIQAFLNKVKVNWTKILMEVITKKIKGVHAYRGLH